MVGFKDYVEIAANILLIMGLTGTGFMILYALLHILGIVDLKNITKKLCGIVVIIWVVDMGCGAFLLYSRDVKTKEADKADKTQKEVGDDLFELGVSKDIEPGVVLALKDTYLESRDYEITVKTGYEEIEVIIWDFADEDGDYIQVITGTADAGEPFMIGNKPRTLKVPSKGKTQIKGIEDGGGGITYGLYVPLTGETYFNMAPLDGLNTYTIAAVKE